MKRRFAAFLLIVCLLAGLLPVSAAAADEWVDVTFSVMNGTMADGESSIVIPFPYGHILEEADLPDGMEPLPNFGGGYWLRNPIGTEITEEIGFFYNFLPLTTVTFDACGGTFENGENDTSIQLVCGQTCGELPGAPVLDGCFFMGWFTGEDGFGIPFTEKSVVENDLVVYARWGDLVNITCDGNGGFWTIREDGGSVFTKADHWEIRVPSHRPWGDFLPEEPRRADFAFEGWSTATDGDVLGNDAVFTEDATVFARWRQLYTLKFSGNGAEAADLPESRSDISNTFTIPDGTPSRPGYDFMGWNTLADGSGQDFLGGETITLPEDRQEITLYAIWQRRSCTVAFDGLSEISCLWGESLGRLPELTPPEGEACRFDGWATADGTVFEADTPVFESLILYPRWIKVVEITFQIVNGTWEENGQTAYTITVDRGSDLTGKLPTPKPDPGNKATGSWDVSPASVSGGTFTYTCDLRDVFTVTFLVDGAEFSAVEVTDGGCLGELPTPSKEGREFLGWFTAAQGGEKLDADTKITKSRSLYARWATVFSLHYDANAEDGSVTGLPADQVEIREGDRFEFTVSDAKPARTGYTFLGWADENGVPVQGSCIAAGAVTLYAQWEEVLTTFTLRYDANGGENPPPPDVRTVPGTACTFTVTDLVPAREGWLFRGWAWDPAAPDPEFHHGDLCSVTGEGTLYAVWEEIAEKATVYFLVDGAEFYRIELDQGQALSLPTDPTRQGYVFREWNTRWDGTGEKVNEQTLVSKDLVVYAQWDQNQQVVVDFVDREVHLTQITLDRGSGLEGRFPDPPSRKKYQFAGWNTDPDGGGQTIDGSTPIMEDITLYADWEEITRASVTFIDRGQTVTAVRLELGASLGENIPDPPEWKGHRFMGWNTQEDGTGKKAIPSTEVQEDVTYFARWEEIEYVRVIFMDRGKEVSDLTLERGKKPGDEMPPNPTRSGYTFKGWNLEEDGSGKKFYKSTAVQEDVIVYAQWAQKAGSSGKGSNPRTGDSIFTALGVLLFSGLALAALALNRRKKR